ncbi:hypothetical protein T484DRAFT_1984042 [Baffinella frigidus]|nr:hypothetical protein T484DRAFT_1984042 [Cryptophyta sp. CCMP2293]
MSEVPLYAWGPVVILWGWAFLRSEVPGYRREDSFNLPDFLPPPHTSLEWRGGLKRPTPGAGQVLQGYLAHKKLPPP